MANRATEHLSRIPIATTALIVTNLAIHFTFVVTSAELSYFSLNTRKVLSGEYYRVISSSFTHAGILHVLMNMTSLLQLGSDLESQYGSMKFAIFTLWSILITGALYVLLTCMLSKILHDSRELDTNSVGFSGVLFSYAVVEAFHASRPTRSFFGMCSVPSKLFPFLLLIGIQIVVPNVSLMGHLSGVCAGLITVGGLTERLMPSKGFSAYLEDRVFPFSLLGRMTNYVRCSENQNQMSAMLSTEDRCICDSVKLLLTTVCGVCAVVRHIFRVDTCCQGLTERASSCWRYIFPMASSNSQYGAVEGREDSIEGGGVLPNDTDSAPRTSTSPSPSPFPGSYRPLSSDSNSNTVHSTTSPGSFVSVSMSSPFPVSLRESRTTPSTSSGTII